MFKGETSKLMDGQVPYIALKLIDLHCETFTVDGEELAY